MFEPNTADSGESLQTLKLKHYLALACLVLENTVMRIKTKFESPKTCVWKQTNKTAPNQGVSIPGVRASLSAYLAHLVTCCECNASQRKTSNLQGYYHLINNSFEHNSENG